MKRLVTLRINGSTEQAAVETHHTLLEVLRRDFKLFGAREACGIGMCGSCTVLIDGKPMSSCLLLASMIGEDQSIQTIEGLGHGENLHPVQEAFVEHSAFQCSYCTPGFILSTIALLEDNGTPTSQEIKEYLAGNLCRCGSYVKIHDAVRSVADRTDPEGAVAP